MTKLLRHKLRLVIGMRMLKVYLMPLLSKHKRIKEICRLQHGKQRESSLKLPAGGAVATTTIMLVIGIMIF